MSESFAARAGSPFRRSGTPARRRKEPVQRDDADVFAAKVRRKGKNALGMFVIVPGRADRAPGKTGEDTSREGCPARGGRCISRGGKRPLGGDSDAMVTQ